MTESTIIELIHALENKLTAKAFANEQRNLMTKALRFILVFQSLKMMYDYKLNLVVRTPRACPWESSAVRIWNVLYDL